MNVEKLFEAISALPQVSALALGGSRASEKNDEKSDYDIYVYLSSNIPDSVKADILSQYCSVMEISNHYWELEDNCTLKNGIDIDIIYRRIDDFEKDIADVVTNCNPRNGYTTCMWHNLLGCKIIYDQEGKLAALQNKFNVPYPDELQKNIITLNRKLLGGVLPSYDMQIKKAVMRHDIVSINHRVSEFIASYFDTIFALNKLTHPGEKRLITLAKEKCELLPAEFESNLTSLFKTMFYGDITPIVADIISKLDDCLKAAGFDIYENR